MTSDARSRLLRFARARFLKHGFAGTSLDAVRREAGVSNGSVFHFFPSKNHVARALYVDALESYQAAIHAMLDGDPPGQAGIEGLIAAHIDWALAHREDARVLSELRHATSVEDETPDLSGVNADVFGALRAWVKGCVERDEMEPLPFDVWMAIVFAPLLRLTPSWVAKRRAKVSPAVRRALAAGAWNAVRKQSQKRSGS